jgi:hypothetical protein
MSEPITTALLVGLAAQKFAEGAAGKAAEKLIENLWNAIAARFQGRPKVAAELEKLADPQAREGAIANVTRVLDAELFEDEPFAAQLQHLGQQILQIQSQSQSQTTNTFTSRDSSQMRAVGTVQGDAYLGDQQRP